MEDKGLFDWGRFFDLSRDLLCIAGFDGRFRELNASWQETLGYPLEELSARPFLDFVHPDDQGATARETSALASGGVALAFENRYRHRDGSYRRLSWNAVGDPQLGLIYAAARDVTADRDARTALQRSHRDLELRLQAHTIELERRNRELEEFVYVASHDLQEPLRKVLAFGERLSSQYAEVLDERGLDYLRRMIGAAERMQQLIDNLLTFSRVTTQARPSEPVELATVTREALRDLSVRVEETKGRVEVAETLPVVTGDPVQLRQLFQNLIANALRYHPPDAPPVVRVRPGDETTPSDGLAEILVEDEGIGFDEKYLPRIFQPFQRLHGRGEYQGNGIGLAICRRIVERHGGEITARSRPGEGATFVVRLPLGRERGAS